MKLMRWLHYFRHVSLFMLVGKVLHVLKSRAVAYFPNFAPPWQIHSPLSVNARLISFARTYSPMGDRFSDATLLNTFVFSTKGVQFQFAELSAISWDDPFPNEPEKKHWQHDFSFFSWSIALVQADPSRGYGLVAELVAALERAHPIKGRRLHFVWTPIALSLRILALVTTSTIALRSAESIDDSSHATIQRHIALCAGLLELTIERYLSYNHLVFSATALAAAGEFLGLSLERDQFAALACRTLNKHILGDGMWAERSPSYHIHMLLLSLCLREIVPIQHPDREQLIDSIQRMSGALGAFVHSDGEIAIFNDSAIKDSVPPASVGWLKPDSRLSGQLLPEGGFASLRVHNTSVVFDAGPLGPNDVIGHGHADFLSIEVCWRGHRLIVDPGVASISNDELRQYTRSAQSHNGPTYSELEPAQFFGAWRVGWRGTAEFEPPTISERHNSLLVRGFSSAYSRHLGPSKVTRSVELYMDGTIHLIDNWQPYCALHPMQSSFLIPSEWGILVRDRSRIILSSAECGNLEFVLEKGILLNQSVRRWWPCGPLLPSEATQLLIGPENGACEVSLWLRPLGGSES